MAKQPHMRDPRFRLLPPLRGGVADTSLARFPVPSRPRLRSAADGTAPYEPVALREPERAPLTRRGEEEEEEEEERPPWASPRSVADALSLTQRAGTIAVYGYHCHVEWVRPEIVLAHASWLLTSPSLTAAATTGDGGAGHPALPILLLTAPPLLIMGCLLPPPAPWTGTLFLPEDLLPLLTRQPERAASVAGGIITTAAMLAAGRQGGGGGGGDGVEQVLCAPDESPLGYRMWSSHTPCARCSGAPGRAAIERRVAEARSLDHLMRLWSRGANVYASLPPPPPPHERR